MHYALSGVVWALSILCLKKSKIQYWKKVTVCITEIYRRNLLHQNGVDNDKETTTTPRWKGNSMRNFWTLLIFFSSSLYAQQQSFRFETALAEAEDPVRLSKMDVDVKIQGEIAETRTTMTFYNPNARILEGNLNFPLPEGATLSGYALDVNGVMVDGVIVEKHEARRIFEREERKGVDPGLVEWVKENNFQTRIYPIPAKGSRTIMIRHLSELPRRNGQTSYYLPLKLAERVEQFHIRAEVIRPVLPPVISKGAPTGFHFAEWRNSYVAETALEDVVLDENLLIGLPEVEKNPVRVERSVDGKYYFVIQEHEAASYAPTIDRNPQPSRITLYWDVSGSRGKSDHKRELALLKMLFEKWLAAPVTVNLVLFSNKAEASHQFSIVGGNAEDLLEALKTATYDGGTQMAAISPAGDGKIPDFYLLFSDGLSNFGDEKPAEFNAPVYAVSGDPTANHAFLSWLTLRTQGRYFNLAQLDDKAVVNGIGRPVYSFMKARYDKNSIRETHPQIPEPVDGRFLLAGKLVIPSAEIILEFGMNGRVLKTVKYVIHQRDGIEGNLLGTLWAQKKIKDLSVFPDENQKTLTAVGQQFGLVTPGTSLLVLERLEQYVEYKITPPVSLPKLRKAYLEQMAGMRKEKAKANKLEDILKLWNSRVAWWETDFSKKNEENKAVGRGSGRGERGVVGRIPGGLVGGVAMVAPAAVPNAIPAPPPPPPPPSVAVHRSVLGISGQGIRAENFVTSDSSANLESGLATGDSMDKAADAASIAVSGWDSKTPYIQKLKKADPSQYAEMYREERERYGNSPAFFLDCADFFIRNKRPEMGLRILSNIAELQLENPAFFRILAHRLIQIGRTKLSIPMFEEVLKMRPEEPQSYLDLAMALVEQKKYQRAMELLNHIVMTRWDRFEEIEVIALMELNRIIPLARAQGIQNIPVDPQLIRLLDVDVRVVLTWDADMTDIDLWVTEPMGEKAYYDHPLSSRGGHVSKDFTQGYGPEEYVIHHAMPGKYLIQANYYGSTAQKLQGPVTVQATVFINYGRKNEKRERFTLRLEGKKDTYTVGAITF